MKQTANILTYAGLLLVAAGCLLPLLMGPQSTLFKFIYPAGALMTFIGRLMSPYKGRNLRVKRLVRIQSWSALFFCVAAFFIWYSDNPKDWIVFTLAGGAIQCYVSIVLPNAMSKAGE